MNITSNHLELAQQLADPYDPEDGEEMSKRVEYFGWPVGKSACIFFYEAMCRQMTIHFMIDDPNAEPVLIGKIRIGQELRLKCYAKKVRYYL